jgi:phospholipid/cholesterol/gamma-HCH transport system ATP-binding protein
MSEGEEGGETVIRVRGLVTRFGAETVHDGVDLDVRSGEALGVVGGSGSGKSVLLRAIIGLKPPQAGRVTVFGKDVFAIGRRERRQLEQRWGVLFQDGALFTSLTVAENVAVPLREYLRLPARLVEEIVAFKIALARLPPDSGVKFPAQLSGGMRKRAGLARALALDPEILFLDEPTSGLDPVAAAEFDQLVRDLRASLGLTVFLVTHDLDSLFAVCDRIALLINKRLRVGTLEEHLRSEDPWTRAYFHGPRGRAAETQWAEAQRAASSR